MIYLIGGSPRGGKTILSKKLSKILDIPYLSTDHLRLVVMPYFHGVDKDDNFPFEKMIDWAGIDQSFKNYSGQEMLKADVREAKTLWPGIESLLRNLSISKANYIIEGVHFLPSLVKQFKDDKNFKLVLLTKRDTDKIFNGLLQNRNNGDWIADNIQDDSSLLIAARSLSEYGEYFIEESRKYGFMCINTEENFYDRIDDAISYLKS